jgi:arylsulfatase A-like enzyme
VTPPISYRPEGVDIIGVVQKRATLDRTLFWRLPTPPTATGPQPPTQRAARRGQWKYVDDRGQYFLFDLRTDPGERHDLARQHADVVREIRALVAKWEADVDAEARQRATEQ